MKPKWMDIAEKELGQHEIAGPKANTRIVEYHAATSLRATSDEVAWCSAFANWCMAKAGLAGTNSAAARSWLNWGVAIEEPVIGCIVVLERGGDPWAGHVGFFAGHAGSGRINLLGGNQGDAVSVSSFPAIRVLGYRLPKVA